MRLVYIEEPYRLASRRKFQFIETPFLHSPGSLNVVQNLEDIAIAAILPQHGAIVPEHLVPTALDYIRELQCRLDLLYP